LIRVAIGPLLEELRAVGGISGVILSRSEIIPGFCGEIVYSKAERSVNETTNFDDAGIVRYDDVVFLWVFQVFSLDARQNKIED
jgi:hypothetical protein